MKTIELEDGDGAVLFRGNKMELFLPKQDEGDDGMASQPAVAVMVCSMAMRDEACAKFIEDRMEAMSKEFKSESGRG